MKIEINARLVLLIFPLASIWLNRALLGALRYLNITVAGPAFGKQTVLMNLAWPVLELTAHQEHRSSSFQLLPTRFGAA